MVKAASLWRVQYFLWQALANFHTVKHLLHLIEVPPLNLAVALHLPRGVVCPIEGILYNERVNFEILKEIVSHVAVLLIGLSDKSLVIMPRH